MQNQNNEWSRFNLQGLLELEVAFATDSIATACIRAITSRLLSSGIVFTNKKFNKVASSEFQSHINTHFVRFVRDAVNQIAVLGFAVYIIENTVPRVLPVGMCDLRYRVNTDTYNIEIAAFKEDEVDDNVFVMVESAPDVRGQIRSCMAAYYTSRLFKDSTIRNCLVADALRARPPVYTYTITDQAFDERDLEHVGEIDGLKASIQKDNIISRNNITMSAHERQEQLVAMLNRRNLNGRESDPDTYRTDPVTKLKNYDYDIQYEFQPIIPLPNDARACVAPQAQTRPDIVQIMETTARMCCVCFGVNSESIGLASSSGHSSAEAIMQANAVTTNTVEKYKSLVSPFLIDIYKVIWTVDSTAIEQMPAENEAPMVEAINPTTKPNLEDEIVVLFPSTVQASTMEKLFLLQVLKYDAYKTYLHESLQIPLGDFENNVQFPDLTQPNNPTAVAKKQTEHKSLIIK